MSRILLGAGLSVLLATGCGKPSARSIAGSPQPLAANPETTTVAAPAPAEAPASPQGLGLLSDGAGTVVITNSQNVDATLAELSMALRQYVIRTRSVPRSFDEFATRTRLMAPAPPSGKRYAIEGQAVVLINQ